MEEQDCALVFLSACRSFTFAIVCSGKTAAYWRHTAHVVCGQLSLRMYRLSMIVIWLLVLDADLATLRKLADNPLVRAIHTDTLLAPADVASKVSVRRVPGQLAMMAADGRWRCSIQVSSAPTHFWRAPL